MVFTVDKWASETKTSVSPLTKVLVTIDQIQEALLGGTMKTTTTSINEMLVQRLTNNVVFQIRRTLDAGPGKFSHYCISPLVWETLLL